MTPLIRFLPATLLTLTLMLSGCGGDSPPEAAEPPVYPETEQAPESDLPDRPQTTNDFTRQAQLLISGSEDLEPGDSLNIPMPLPVGNAVFIVQRNDVKDDNSRHIEGIIAAPNSGFFNVRIKDNRLSGFVQTNSPRAAYNIYHQPDMDTYELRPVTDRDQIDGGAPLNPSDY